MPCGSNPLSGHFLAVLRSSAGACVDSAFTYGLMVYLADCNGAGSLIYY